MTLCDILSIVFSTPISNKDDLKREIAAKGLKRSLEWIAIDGGIDYSRDLRLLNECFLTKGKNGKRRNLIRKPLYQKLTADLEGDGEVSPYEDVDFSNQTIYMRWDRMNIPSRTKLRLEMSYFFTAIIAEDLATYNVDKVPTFINLYLIAFDILGISYDASLLKRLCPSNFAKAREDWNKAIAGHEFNDEVLAYDLLNNTLYIALWRLRSTDPETDVAKVSSCWLNYLNEKSSRLSSDEPFQGLEDIIQDCLEKSTTSTAEKTHLSKSANNKNLFFTDGFRDPRFARQANLYYEIDMQAITSVINSMRRKDLVVLDLGCGDGEVTCTRFGGIAAVSKIVGIDINPKQIAIAQQRMKRDANSDKYLLAELDIRKDDFVFQLRRFLRENEIEKVDIIFSALTFHYLENPEGILSHVRTLLADDGFVILRELNDETKLYFSQGDVKSAWLEKAVDSYRKVFNYSDRNCSKKLYSWFSLQGFSDIKMFYDTIDTCGKNAQEKEDLFYIMVGFRKARAEERLEKERSNLPQETIEELNNVISACNELQYLFKENDFWFFCVNFIAIAKNRKVEAVKTAKDCPPIELYIVRHAHCNYTETEDGLDVTISATGKKQIKQLANRLSNVEFDEIICSEMDRTYLTVSPVAMSHDLKIQRYEELNEIDRGDINTDDAWQNSMQYYHRWKQHNTDLPFPNGENGTEVWLREKYVIDRIKERASARGGDIDKPYRVCLVSHGGAIRAMICGLLGLPQQLRYQLAEDVHPCSLSIVKIAGSIPTNVNSDRPATLELFNDISFLKADNIGG